MHSASQADRVIPHWLGLAHKRRGQRRYYGQTCHAASNRASYYLALSVIALLVLACINMAFVMTPGLPLNMDVQARQAFLSTHRLSWQLGWLSWMASATGLLIVCYLLSQSAPASNLRQLGFTLVAIGIAPDLSAEMIYAFVLPDITSVDTFLLLDRISMLLTGFIANGLYCLGGLLINLALFANQRLSRKMLYFGLPSWLIGLFISLFTVMSQLPLAATATAISMVWNILWLFWFSVTVLRHR